MTSISREERVALVERLRRKQAALRRDERDQFFTKSTLVNPDGPEAAAEIERLAALSPDERLIEALTMWRKLVNEGGVPRYTITPGAALNVLVTMTDAILSTTKADQ